MRIFRQRISICIYGKLDFLQKQLIQVTNKQENKRILNKLLQQGRLPMPADIM